MHKGIVGAANIMAAIGNFLITCRKEVTRINK